MTGGPCAARAHCGTVQGADPRGVEGAASGKGGAASSALRHQRVPAHPAVFTVPASPAWRACLLRYLGRPRLAQTRPSPGAFGLGLSWTCHEAALVASLPRIHPASLRLKTGLVPRKAQHSLLQRVKTACLGEEFGNKQAAAARHVTWLLTDQQPGTAALLFVCCLFSKSEIQQWP